jgi:hypothetical protein
MYKSFQSSEDHLNRRNPLFEKEVDPSLFMKKREKYIPDSEHVTKY